MTRRLVAIGLLLLWPAATLGQSAATSSTPTSMYMKVLDSVRREIAASAPKEEVSQFVQAVFAKKGDTLSSDDILKALSGDRNALCAKKSTREALPAAKCEQLIQRITQLVKDEQSLIDFSHSLQNIATSYELPAGVLPASIAEGPIEGGIADFWRVGTNASRNSSSSSSRMAGGPVEDTTEEDEAAEAEPITGTDRRLRTLPFPTTLQGPLGQLSGRLASASEFERIGIVWHYLHGVKFVRGERTDVVPAPDADDETLPENAPGTERQYLYKTQNLIEESLMAILDGLQAETDKLDPPLAKDEIVLFHPSVTVGDNIVVWGRSDDVGLQYALPMDTNSPALVSGDQPILGGRFPPPPPTDEDGAPAESQGECSHPLLWDGYLCRPIDQKDADCAEEVEADPEKITLTSCTAKTATQSTLAGPDICKEVEWRDGGFDPRYQCKVQIGCSDLCNDSQMQPNPLIQWNTYVKKPDGVVQTCIKNEGNLPHLYLGMMGISLAHRVCNIEPGTQLQALGTREESLALCCSVAGASAQTACNAMDQDGLLLGDPEAGDTPMSVSDCVDAVINDACQTTCYRRTREGFNEAIMNRAARMETPLPDPCTGTFDIRSKRLVEAAENRDDMCQADRPVSYPATIGNTLCKFGACLEESLEMSRITPSDVPAHTTAQGFPNESDTKRMPLSGLTREMPEKGRSLLPTYRPAALAQSFDTALCQINGLPATTPPALCAFNPTQRLSLPIDDLIRMTESLAAQPLRVSSSTDLLERMGAALGAKIGAEMYARYLAEAAKGITDTLNKSSDLLEEMMQTKFPDEMCRLGDQFSSSSTRNE